MYRTNDVVQWLITFIAIFAIVYIILLFLPVILAVIGGYMIYVWLKVWWIKRHLPKSYYQFDIEGKTPDDGKIIDAEFEILDEKTRK